MKGGKKKISDSDPLLCDFQVHFSEISLYASDETLIAYFQELIVIFLYRQQYTVLCNTRGAHKLVGVSASL